MLKKPSRIFVFIMTVIAVVTMIFAYYKDIQNSITLGLDLQGGFEIVYQVTPLNDGTALPDMAAVAASISKRIDVLGVNEPEIMVEGTDRIRVQLAGVSNLDDARKMISTTANLSFRDTKDNLLADSTILTAGGAVVSRDDTGAYIISLKIANQDKFYEITDKVSKMTDNIIVAWLDYNSATDSYAAEKKIDDAGGTPRYISAASVKAGIKGNAQISGNFTLESAKTLSNMLNSGSLPVKMTEVYSNVISAEYGIKAFNVTAFAGVLGVLGVMLFMLLVYRLPGAVSAFMLLVYIFVTFIIYNNIGGVFTLPGIAALVLGVGMTVDANIITFERIKDELLLGRSVETSYTEGHKLAWITIIDSQMTTFIAGLIMYIYGTGAVKGFATMLMVTLVGTLLINVFFVKFVLGLLVKSGLLDNKKSWFGINEKYVPDVTKGEERKYFGPFSKFDFIGGSRKFIYASLIILGLGLLSATYNGFSGKGPLNLGIDFSSGTKLTVNSNIILDEATITSDFETLGLVNFNVQMSGTKVAYITTKEALTRTQIDTFNTTMKQKYGLSMNDNVVTPMIGNELVKNAIIAALLAWILMLVYIRFRFSWDYGWAAVVALLHDVFMVLAIFAIFRFEVNTELIAVILAIIGYSVDDTIVIFDRIRETLKYWGKPSVSKQDYRNIVNNSLRTVAVRSIFNTVTTIIPIAFLLSLGSPAIFIFNLAMFIGLVSGAYSSIFIAAQLWYYMQVHKKPKVVKAKKFKKKHEIEELTVIGMND